jgi:Choline/ethanolamine kinase
MARNSMYDENAERKIMNYMNYPYTHIHYAVPFNTFIDINMDELDEILLPPSSVSGKSATFKIPKKNRIKRNTYLLTPNQYNLLAVNIHWHYQRISADIIKRPELKRLFNVSDGNQNVMMKVIEVSTYRQVFTALKEIFMQDQIYNSSWNDIRGSSIVSKPLMCSIAWTGEKWVFLLITEYASGSTVDHHLGFFQKLFRKYDKTRMYKSLEDAITTLWLLGFSHNDLSGYNVIYDASQNKTTIIDFETCVQIPQELVIEFRQTYKKNKEKSLSEIYIEFYRRASLSLLCLSESVCIHYAPDDKIMYNTDDTFLHRVRSML